MTVTRLNDKYSKITPDTGKTLVIGDDEQRYSVITCKHKMVAKIREEAAESL